MTWSGASSGEHFVASNPPQLTAQNIYFLTPPTGGNDSSMIQAAIDACSAAGGGEVWGAGSYKANVILKEGVVLRGPGTGIRTPWTVPAFLITANATGYPLDTPAGATSACGAVGVGLHGLGAGTAGGGLRFRNVQRGIVKQVTCNNFADEGILAQSSSQACEFDEIFLQNCVLNRSRSATIGAFDIDGNDHHVDRVESTISGSIEGNVQSASLWCVGIEIRGAGHTVSRVEGEFSDIGIQNDSLSSHFSDSVADHNYGHGWHNAGNGEFVNCRGLENGLGANNTYDNWLASSTVSGNSQYVNCRSASVSAVVKYAFEDRLNSDANKSRYVNCFHTGVAVGTRVFGFSTAGHSNGVLFASGDFLTLTANSATPDVTAWERWLTANSSGTTITNFTGGTPGQRIMVFCNDSNTTIQHNGATIILKGGGNKKLQSGVFYEFMLGGTIWREVKAYPFTLSADNGDAAKSIQADLSETTQIWATALTANRAVTLSATGAYNGAKFRIVRKASATGASTLDVGTGPLKSLALGQWCDVEHDGAAWILSAFGSL